MWPPLRGEKYRKKGGLTASGEVVRDLWTVGALWGEKNAGEKEKEVGCGTVLAKNMGPGLCYSGGWGIKKNSLNKGPKKPSRERPLI